MTGQQIEKRTAAAYPAPTMLTTEQLTYISRTEFVPPGLRGNVPAILACVATGRAIGIDDMTAIRSIHIIDGKPTFSAELMVQLVRRRGHSIVGKVTEGKATVTGTRVDNGDSMEAEWTSKMAERAGLLNKGNWKKYPEAMLWARAVSQLCRMLFADCFAAGTYTSEELGDESLSEALNAVPAATDDKPDDGDDEPREYERAPIPDEEFIVPVEESEPEPPRLETRAPQTQLAETQLTMAEQAEAAQRRRAAREAGE